MTLDKHDNFEACKMSIPYEMNSICVIDGQHRIFSYYEGNENDKSERKISKLRKKLHLLVTGLIFPSTMGNLERLQIQSKIFLDINSNAKAVPPDVLLQIQELQNPFSDFGIARKVIYKLNRGSLFCDKFEMSTLDKGKIKIASIIKFALRYLVTIVPSDAKPSIYTYWTGNKDGIIAKDEKALDEYIEYISKILEIYFKAIKKNNIEAWNDPGTNILSVTSINGYIIALTRQLPVNGIKDFLYYDSCFEKFSVDYSKGKFGYTSSQYRRFSNYILEKAFKIDIQKY